MLLATTQALSTDHPHDEVSGALEDCTAVTTGVPTSGELIFRTVGVMNVDGCEDIASSTFNNDQQDTVPGLPVY